MVKKWVSLGEFTSYDLNNKEKEYLKLMSSIPNFDKREKKCKKTKKKKEEVILNIKLHLFLFYKR